MSYEIAVDLLINLPDTEVLDIFSRLNSYAVILNDQEKLNAQYFGPFKSLADHLGRKYTEFWTANAILTPKEILRMGEVSLVAELLIAQIEGIKAKKRIKPAYKAYENNFHHDIVALEDRFDQTMGVIGQLFPMGLKGSEFSRPFLFYSLFTAVYHSRFGLTDFAHGRPPLETDQQIATARNGLERVEELFLVLPADLNALEAAESAFLNNSRRATTDQSSREARARFLLDLMA
ncbi:MAG: hypothetical protein H0X36_06970 [Sphingomonadaceae bacterium]|nr:hypothetical protein [Sphingomonadaceae bacterium]